MKLKYLFSATLACLLSASMLAGCSGKNDVSAAVSGTVSSSASEAVVANSTVSSMLETVPDQSELNPVLQVLLDACAIEGSIDVTKLDLETGGIALENIENFTAAESSTSMDNGGIVIVIKAVSGTSDAVVANLESFRDSRLDDRYAEYAVAMENTKQARIASVSGDIVVYAVSASGDWQALDDAIKNLG